MTIGRIAALPMYDFADVADSHDQLWSAVADQLASAGITDVPRTLTRDLDHVDTWRHPGLLLGQACEYPLAKFYAKHVRVVATPCYRVPGCEGFRYRSAIVVRRDDPAASLESLRQRRCVVNQFDSNSGMNLLRAAIAPLARGKSFFRAVQLSGSHACSASMVAEGDADVAALDCVSYAHLRRCQAMLMEKLRILAWTPASPSLPFVTSRTTDDATLAALRAALAQISAASMLAGTRLALFLDGVDCEPREDFAEVLALEEQARRRGYPALA